MHLQSRCLGANHVFLVWAHYITRFLECGAIVIYGKKVEGTSVLCDMDPCSNFTEGEDEGSHFHTFYLGDRASFSGVLYMLL